MKRFATEIRWALIYTAMTFAWTLTGKLFGFHDERIAYGALFNTLILLPSVLVYFLAIREKRKVYYQGRMSYGQGLVSGLVLTLFIALLGPLHPTFAYAISPELFRNSIRFTVGSGQMTREQAEHFFTLPSFIIQGIGAALVFGAIFSLVAAAFLQKKGSMHHA